MLSQAQILTGYYPQNQSVGVETPLPQQPSAPEQSRAFSPSLTGFASSGANAQETSEDPVDFEADSMSYDETGQEVIATGNVIITQQGRILRADEVRYNIAQDKVSARGNVVLNEPNGDIHFSQYFELQDQMKNGVVEELQTTLVDGSRFHAVDGERQDGTRILMRDATYTPCDLCVDNPDRAVPWQIRAAQVQHDEEEANIEYKHARFEVYGVPVAYTPYFAHPDGTVEQKSGFLAPSAGFKSEWGAFVENNYYWAIAPDKDMTFGLIAMTEQAPLGILEYRQRWENAMFEIEGGLTYSDRTDELGEDNFDTEEEWRGHIFADALWEMNNKWRSGFNIEYVSDDQYAREYDITSAGYDDLTSEDVLESRIFAERFSGRDYTLVQLQRFQDTRISELEADQPELLPEITTSFIGEPGAVPLIKGRWDFAASFLNLMRDGSGQDQVRASVDGGWKRRLVSDTGLVTNADISLRGDLYQISDRDVAFDGSGRSGESTKGRFYPQAHLETSYPVVRPLRTAHLYLEPMVALTAAPTLDPDEDIPNEDSLDVQLDASNLFSSNRFPGYDAVEDGSRTTYGLRSRLQAYNGDYVEGFIGQSYRFEDDNNPFLAGSGLDDQNSDVVGSLDARFGDSKVDGFYDFSYRFQLDNDSLSSTRHEFNALADWNRFRLSGNYLYAKRIEGTEIDEDREQIEARADFYWNKNWETWSSAKYDLGSDPGLRRVRLGLNYYGQCVSWGLIGVQNYTDDASGDSDSEILFTIGLKNLSGFLESDLEE